MSRDFVTVRLKGREAQQLQYALTKRMYVVQDEICFTKGLEVWRVDASNDELKVIYNILDQLVDQEV